MDLDSIIEALLVREGGFVYHPADKGGPTKFGITLTTLSEWRGRYVSPAELIHLTKDEARKIYKERYYEQTPVKEMPELIQPQAFDICVHSGPTRAVRLLQEAVNILQPGALIEDGNWGPNTLRLSHHVALLWGTTLGDVLVDRRILFFAMLIQREGHHDDAAFIGGWVRRALEFKSYVME